MTKKTKTKQDKDIVAEEIPLEDPVKEVVDVTPVLKGALKKSDTSLRFDVRLSIIKEALLANFTFEEKK